MKIYNTLKLCLGLLSVASLFNSCEGFRSAQGTIADSSTRQPLAGVTCTVTSGKEVYVTDSTGRFKVYNEIGWCLGGCADISVRFSKEGYQTIDTVNPAPNAMLLMPKR